MYLCVYLCLSLVQLTNKNNKIQCLTHFAAYGDAERGEIGSSVLVALWALDVKATEQFMSRFYEHLVGGESASESLHEAMKWMRSNGWSEVRQWAPFMLIGDNVAFYLEKRDKFSIKI